MSVPPTKKRAPRAPNYSSDEKLRLLRIINSYKSVVENKKTDAVTWRDKEQAWKAITSEFNASSYIKRTVESVKGFFDNRKRQCHKQAAVDRRGLIGTGGGPPIMKPSDPVQDLTLKILNTKTVFGLKSSYGGDACSKHPQSDHESSFLANSYDYDHNNEGVLGEDISYEEAPNDAIDNFSFEESEQIPLTSSEVSNDHQVYEHNYSEEPDATNWAKYTPKDLQKPMHKKLSNPYNTAKRNKTNSDIPSPITKNSNPSRRRPSMSATMSVSRKYEDLCEVKKEVVETQLEIYKRFKEHQNEIMKLEIEEKKTTMYYNRELFEVELAIKRAQLEKLQM